MPRLTSQQGSPSAILRLIDKPIVEMTDAELEEKLTLLRGARLAPGVKAKKRAPVGNASVSTKRDDFIDGEDIL